MPTITAAGKTFPCETGANLRRALLDNGIDLHNGQAKLINCRGIGSCGHLRPSGLNGETSPRNWRENQRLAFPPHRRETSSHKRLACQTRIFGNVTVTKYTGFWGQDDTIRWGPDSAAG
ncbi:MAG: 2Fe-2S iron-sulfur cluster binding domain-containing protein [Leptolyngbya sp. RL_3_1]|nr:2Fe-2S iron-sulfur cluster binding domain-containing protein [Leptolyngbya sp. RL_3_1]